MTGALAADAQNPIFSTTADEVRVAVFVSDNDKPVLGLNAADFEITDNGVRQEIQYTTHQMHVPISAILVFDMGSSVASELLDHLKGAASRLLADLKHEDRAALITFSNAVDLGSPLTRDRAQVWLALDRLQSAGNSSLIDGSLAGLVLAESSLASPFLIIFSDGRDTFSWRTAEAVLEKAKRSDAVVYAVSAGRLLDRTFLVELTRSTGGSLFEVESIDNLAAVFLNILGEFRQRYLVIYKPRGVSESGWHRLDVRVKSRSVKVRARPVYMRSSPDE